MELRLDGAGRVAAGAREGMRVRRGGRDDICAQSCVQLWTTGNFHWYLKHELVFAEARRPPARTFLMACSRSCLWSGAKSRGAGFPWRWPRACTCSSAHDLSPLPRLRRYQIARTTDASPPSDQCSSATVAVADGASLLITPFHEMVRAVAELSVSQACRSCRRP